MGKIMIPLILLLIVLSGGYYYIIKNYTVHTVFLGGENSYKKEKIFGLGLGGNYF